MAPKRVMGEFDPGKVAYCERENWAAYYQKRWLRLIYYSVILVKEAFGLSFWQALYGAYLVARAEMAAAPYPDNDIPRAEHYMQRFYAFIKKVHRTAFDVQQAAQLEVNWWVIHRQLSGQGENEELVEALRKLYVAVYGLAPERAQLIAYHRAQAMIFSDRWVSEGRKEGSPLLAQMEQELVIAYTALYEAL